MEMRLWHRFGIRCLPIHERMHYDRLWPMSVDADPVPDMSRPVPKILAGKICLVRLSAIGDTVHAIGLVNALREIYRHAHLTWILEPLPYEVAKQQANVDRFVVFDPKKGVWAFEDLRRQLAGTRYDLLVLPQVSFRSSLVAAHVKARAKLGFDWSRSRELHWLFTNVHLPPGPIRHAQELMLEFAQFLGLCEWEPNWGIRFTAEEVARMQEFFGGIGRKVVSIVVGSSNPERNWVPERMGELADRIDRELDLQPMLVGGPSRLEREIVDRALATASSRPIVALDKPLRDTMWKLAGSTAVISPDTGPLHIAVAMNRPVIGLYGYTNPRRVGPWRKFHDLLVDAYHDPDDRAGAITRQTRPGRMERITVDEVFEKVKLALERYPR